MTKLKTDDLSERPAKSLDCKYKTTAWAAKKLYPYDTLFSPICCNRLTLKNRVVMAPMGNLHMAASDGSPSQKMLEYYFARAAGGTGLLITDPVEFKPGRSAGGLPRIDSGTLGAWKELCSGVHTLGSRIFMQLVPCSGLPQSDFKRRKTVRAAAGAAFHAKLCGMDGICLGKYSLSKTREPSSSIWSFRKRGKGSAEQSFSTELVKEIRRCVGPYFPLMYRVVLSDGISISEALDHMIRLVRAGVDIFSIEPDPVRHPLPVPADPFTEAARTVKEYFRSNCLKSNIGLDIPIAAADGPGYPDLAEKNLRDGTCDMLMLDRALLADPGWCRKAYAGKTEEIRPCASCSTGCCAERGGGHISCAVNARAGYEDIFPAKPIKAEKSKKLAVVGGGRAGMSFAIHASDMGHRVDIFEAGGRLGGSLIAESRPAFKFASENYLHFLIAQCEKRKGITINLNTKADPTMLKKGRYAAIVYAVGPEAPKPPNIPGWGDIPFVYAGDILAAPEKLPALSDKRVIVIGGSRLGCECALWLKNEKGCKKVAVTEASGGFVASGSSAYRGLFIGHLQASGIELLSTARAIKIFEGRLFVQQNVPETRSDILCSCAPALPRRLVRKPTGETYIRNLDADLIVLAEDGGCGGKQFLEAQAQHAAKQICELSIEDPADVDRAAYMLAQQI